MSIDEVVEGQYVWWRAKYGMYAGSTWRARVRYKTAARVCIHVCGAGPDDSHRVSPRGLSPAADPPENAALMHVKP